MQNGQGFGYGSHGIEANLGPFSTKRLQNKDMMTVGRVRAALGCGNPDTTKARRKAWKDLPLPLGRGACDVCPGFAAKGHRSRVVSAFQLPDHRFKGSLRGRTANVFPWARSRS
jgi:hypothetical protein